MHRVTAGQRTGSRSYEPEPAASTNEKESTAEARACHALQQRVTSSSHHTCSSLSSSISSLSSAESIVSLTISSIIPAFIISG